MKKIICTSVVFLTYQFMLTATPSFAVENELGLWIPEWFTIPVTDKWGSVIEASPRLQFNNKTNKFDQFFLRPSIYYKLTEHLTVSQGYSWNPTFNPRFNNDQRIWEQVEHIKPFSRFNLRNRLRLEEIFTHGNPGVGVRPRYLLGVSIPLGKEKKWSFITWDEFWFFLNSSHPGHNAGFDRNWFFVGLNRRFNNYINADFGYNFQIINPQSPAENKLNHVIQINFYVTLPQLIKKKTDDLINSIQKTTY